MGRLLSEITGNPASLTIRIVDYPGEWLLDLPLLGQSCRLVARATLRLMRKRRPAEISGEFLAFLGQHRAEEVASEEVAKQAHDLYCAYLINARDRHGLSFRSRVVSSVRDRSAMCPICGSRRSTCASTACSRPTRSAR
jgi:predicted YcjX-like family ATPase